MSSLAYRPAIDGLRAFAVLSVCLFHLDHSYLPGGFTGVDVFFVISGYLITSIILKDCQAGDFSLARFYQRRIARIFPAFFTVAFASLLGAWWIYSPQDFASAGANLTAAALSVANMKSMLQGNYFELSPDALPFLHYWSLAVEEQFYMFFPFLFLLLFKFAKQKKLLILALLAASSFILCVALTKYQPVWAFYLLPTRAWELLAGSLLAVIVGNMRDDSVIHRLKSLDITTRLSNFGFLVVMVSFFVVHEGPWFPGLWATLPVLGAVAVMLPQGSRQSWSEKLLSLPPIVAIGKMSYSLYLWHWPVFSLIDYKLFLESNLTRLTLKIILTTILAYLSFRFIECPSRVVLNIRKNRSIAYASLIAALLVSVPLGVAIRKANYVNAKFADVAKGGIVFPGKPGGRSVVLMGDSNGSMYGKVMKQICSDLGYRLTVISVAASDALPDRSGAENPLWNASLAVVQKERPDILVLACRWELRLKDSHDHLLLALDELKKNSSRIVIPNQPPILPTFASRSSMHPPIFEDIPTRHARVAANGLLASIASDRLAVLDVASRFQGDSGEVLFLDPAGNQLYHDSFHISGYGAESIRDILQAAIASPL